MVARDLRDRAGPADGADGAVRRGELKAQGHVVTTLLVAMVAMLFTAISYGRMAAAYPSAGSAYVYVGRELHPALGYVTGWSMLFDYVMNPLICVIICSKLAGNYLPQVPYAAWAVFFALLFTGLNLRGVKASARTNAVIAAGRCWRSSGSWRRPCATSRASRSTPER